MFKQERTLAEHRKLVEGVMKRDQKRRKRIEAAGIDYECPEIVRNKQNFFSGCTTADFQECFTRSRYQDEDEE